MFPNRALGHAPSWHQPQGLDHVTIIQPGEATAHNIGMLVLAQTEDGVDGLRPLALEYMQTREMGRYGGCAKSLHAVVVDKAVIAKRGEGIAYGVICTGYVSILATSKMRPYLNAIVKRFPFR